MAGTADPARQDFDEFVAASTSSLLRTAYLMAGELAEAEDAVQETLFRVARRWPRVRKMDQPLAYARRTLVNLVIDGAPRRSRRHAELNEWASCHGPADRGDEAAERAMREVDARFDVAAALACLPPRQRAVVVLRYWADMPEADVAAALGCSVGTVKSTASRALARLREQLSSALSSDSHTSDSLSSDSHTGDSLSRDSHTRDSHTSDSHTSDSHTRSAGAARASCGHGAGLATIAPIPGSAP